MILKRVGLLIGEIIVLALNLSIEYFKTCMFGDKRISHYFFSKQFHSGCGGHPGLEDHRQIASELTDHVRRLMKWQ